MATTLQGLIRAPSYLVIEIGRLNGAISSCTKSKMARLAAILKNSETFFSATHYLLHLMYVLYTEHTLPSDSTVTVDAYDSRLATYFSR